VHVFHGFSGSRLQETLLHEKTIATRVCLIADQPGGLSTPAPERTVLSWAREVGQLADRHAQFDVIGMSCGGAYALGCAHEMPNRIVSVGLLAGMGPMDQPDARGEAHRLGTRIPTRRDYRPGACLPRQP
jgi:pimeloyl-ACP methyl ester carboxylesterase